MFAGGTIILAGGKIDLADGKIILAGGKSYLGGDQWSYPGLVIWRRSSIGSSGRPKPTKIKQIQNNKKNN